MSARIIIINGSGGCGKSTFIKQCINIANQYKSKTVIELSTVDYVKEVAQYCGWDGSKTEKDRAFLHDLKEALAKWNNSPNQTVFNQINSIMRVQRFAKNSDWLFFVNIREPKAIDEFIEQNKDATGLPISTLLIVNSNVPVIRSNEADRDVEQHKYDYVVSNSSDIETLKLWAEYYLDKVLKFLA